MGRKLTAMEETALLRQTIREAHEATQALNAAIREATRLAPALIENFEAVHEREIAALSNFLTEEANAKSAELNTAIDAARVAISDQIMAGKAVFDRNTSTVTISWGPGKFDANAPLPYPKTAPKENKQ